jgi:poly(A) polymerase
VCIEPPKRHYPMDPKEGDTITGVPAKKLFEAFRSAGKELYLVGGYVRDTLLGGTSGDLDFATSALPAETTEILESRGLKAIPIGIEFGTVATRIEHLGRTVQVEITTYRCSESYRKGSRHPEVVFGDSLEGDLVRRDFTVNAMAMDPDGEIVDPFGGRDDLRDGVIRTPLDPVTTFREDPLRMLRAVRFVARLGFVLEERTRAALDSERESIGEISRERWKQEMDGILSLEDGSAAVRALEILRETGLLLEMMPEFGPMLELGDAPQGNAHDKGVWGHTVDVVSVLPPRTVLRWAGLLHDLGKPSSRTVDGEGRPRFYGHEKAGAEMAAGIADRFRFSRRDRKALLYLVASHMRPVLYDGKWGDHAVARLAGEAGEHLEDLLELARADITAHSDEYREKGLRDMAGLGERLSALAPDGPERVLPRELGPLLADMLGSGAGGGRRIGLILARLEELVRSGRLPVMSDPSFYIGFLRDRGDLPD